MNVDKLRTGKCDECGRTKEVARWRESHYHLCMDCALKWSANMRIFKK